MQNKSATNEALLIELLKQSSDISITLLPTGGSLIAYKLLINLYLYKQQGEELTVKSLFASIPFSDMGIRYHLRRLLRDGWIELQPSIRDKRTKVCVPTAKFDAIWLQVLQWVTKLEFYWIAAFNFEQQVVDWLRACLSAIQPDLIK